MPTPIITPSVTFTDATGTATLWCVAPRFANWLPAVDDVGDRQEAVADGVTYFYALRTGHSATFEIANIPAAQLDLVLRLDRHLLSGGTITVATQDVAGRTYTARRRPGGTNRLTFSDPRHLEYTFALEVTNTDAATPMLCDYGRVAR